MEALPISTYNGFYAKSDREYTKGMRKNRYFDEIVRSGISDFHGSFREESRGNRRAITGLCLQNIPVRSIAGIHTRSKMYRRIEFGGNFVEKEKRE